MNLRPMCAEEIREVLLQVAIYGGVPAAVDSFRLANEAFAEIAAETAGGEPAKASKGEADRKKGGKGDGAKSEGGKAGKGKKGGKS
jgi:hypothetical protein